MDEITIKVEEVPEKVMFMSQHLGDGTMGKTKFDASFALPNFALIVSVGGKRYRVHQTDIIEAIIRKIEV